MICIFMVIYAAVLVILYPPKKGKEFVATADRFTLYSLLAGGLAAVVLLPEIYALQAPLQEILTFQRQSVPIFPYLT